MSHKSARIAARIESFCGQELDAHYLGYGDCFNRQLFYEAHEVLEDLWLKDKPGPNGAFYKGLIQLAGGRVHVEKGRLGPAAALFKLALANLEHYPDRHQELAGGSLRVLLAGWLSRLERAGGSAQSFSLADVPRLELVEDVT